MAEHSEPPEQSDFDNSIRRDERGALHSELVSRLHQKGLMVSGDAPDEDMADLMSAIDEFETAVEKAGGDLMLDSPDSSEPERPEFVLPHMHDDESLAVYTRRVQSATERLGPMAQY